MPDKKDIIELLENIADIMDFKGENKFKVGAYRNGALSIRRFEGDFASAVSQKELDKIELHATNDGEPIYRQFGFIEPHDKALEIILK